MNAYGETYGSACDDIMFPSCNFFPTLCIFPLNTTTDTYKIFRQEMTEAPANTENSRIHNLPASEPDAITHSAVTQDTLRQKRFCALVEPHIEAVGRFVHALTRNREEARDVTGDVVLIAFEKLDTLKHEQASASWLFSIARNVLRQRRRRQKFWGFFDEPKAAQRPSEAAQPDVSADVAFLHQALAALPDRQREALILFEIAGLSLKEIHEIQGGTLSGVKSRITRGREELKRRMQDKVIGQRL